MNSGVSPEREHLARSALRLAKPLSVTGLGQDAQVSGRDARSP